MISKKELLQKVRELSGVYLSAAASLDALIEWVNSLPDDQPDVLPFQWPIPDGMEVVTRDGRKVEQLVRFEGIKPPILGIINGSTDIEYWFEDGRKYLKSIDDNDLFLRRKDKKVWVVEWPSGARSIHDDFPNLSPSHQAPIYEATLKPVV